MTATTQPSPATVIAACEAQMRGQPTGLASIGHPEPRTLLDVVRAMWAAQDALTAGERAALARRDRLTLELARQATRGPLGSRHEPRGLA